MSRSGRRRAALEQVKSRTRHSVVLTAALALLGCNITSTADAGPGRLVTLPDGRRINLVCTGRGAPTVLLEGGFGANAGAWYKVQPALARTTQVCSYDRAGSGYSDPGPEPRDGPSIARDLEQALDAAKLSGPFIVVGHSAGGLYARILAARRPDDVFGLILLDPTIERRAPRPMNDGLDGLRQRARRCLATTQANPAPPLNDPAWSGCVGANANPHEIEVAKRSATWSGQVSELDSLFGRTSEEAARTVPVLRSTPLYVITASATADAAPTYGFYPPQSVWELQHQQLAARSQVGSQQTVQSSHMIMLDRPDVVIAAVQQMIAAQRSGRAPEPLPPSEGAASTEDELLKLPENLLDGSPLDSFRPQDALSGAPIWRPSEAPR